MLYLFIFGRRVISLLLYFKDLLLKNLQRIGLGKTKVATQGERPELSLFKRILLRVIKGLYFVYSVVIGSQLLLLGYSEVRRLKGLISFIINNSKMIRIKDSRPQDE